MSTETQWRHHGEVADQDSLGGLSVADFFGDLPWAGQPHPQPETATSTAAAHDSPLLTVGQFMAEFAWEGDAAAAQGTVAGDSQTAAGWPEAPAENKDDDLTLESFAALF